MFLGFYGFFCSELMLLYVKVLLILLVFAFDHLQTGVVAGPQLPNILVFAGLPALLQRSHLPGR